ncbi:glycosyl hydrolase [Halalkalibaculum sp. DA3122]|uniref:glycosyl hydrolase n=1 Tax=Halalkalibaculum sp. DA3122 TaxID=3373607 RepID=UPI003755122C
MKYDLRKKYLYIGLIILLGACSNGPNNSVYQELRSNFKTPTASSHPGVYWYFMDGNMSKKEMTKDLESMKAAGISHLIFLEVNVGIPRGEVNFMSEKWLDLFEHAESVARRLDIAITLGVGPGWTGSGGPWVEGESSMQHLVASETKVDGPVEFKAKLEVPPPHKPFFGESWFTEDLKSRWNTYYQDVRVLAYPTPTYNKKVHLLDEKSLVYRSPYTSDTTTRPHLPAPSSKQFKGLDKASIIDISDHLNKEGILEWSVPKGKWMILRFVSRNNGNVTRPAPLPGVGFEADKFDSTALKNHLDNFLGKIFEKIEPLNTQGKGGLKMLHMDSWEMGAQNWTQDFREEFEKRRGYDPLPYLPVYNGEIVGSLEESERFLWDLRMTSQDLIFDEHVKFIKKYAQKRGLGLSIEPYDMNPTSDLALGSFADVPMAEFWTNRFNSSFSVNEATSIAHVQGKKVVQAEAFTSDQEEKMLHHPASIKNQGDWAFSLGVNRLFYHTFVHKSLGDTLKPGMTMGPYGVHWDRGQTWWPMVADYHTYIARNSYMMQQGTNIADILYLTPEGVPHVFLPPPSAVTGTDRLPDRKGFDFDACYPATLIEDASVKDGSIVFPGGASYQVLVLPLRETMSIQLLTKIEQLLRDGATVIGSPPTRSPSLSGYPDVDHKIKQKAKDLWGSDADTSKKNMVEVGKGRLVFGGELLERDGESLYPGYPEVASILGNEGMIADFSTSAEIRYGHKKVGDIDLYFVSNKTDDPIKTEATFRVHDKVPELWNPQNGNTYVLPEYESNAKSTTIPLKFEPHQSYFIVFGSGASNGIRNQNFPELIKQREIGGPWSVSFDTSWGGPATAMFDSLIDWSTSANDQIKYYSGIASYKKEFSLPSDFEKGENKQIRLNLGDVKNIARISINGNEVGVVWSEPWEIEITDEVREGINKIEIDVANLWANRLIGDQQFKDDGIDNGQWPEWLIAGGQRPSGRYTFVTYPYFEKKSPLQSSGLLGPVTIENQAL